jgi:hypothetical protein
VEGGVQGPPGAGPGTANTTNAANAALATNATARKKLTLLSELKRLTNTALFLRIVLVKLAGVWRNVGRIILSFVVSDAGDITEVEESASSSIRVFDQTANIHPGIALPGSQQGAAMSERQWMTEGLRAANLNFLHQELIRSLIRSAFKRLHLNARRWGNQWTVGRNGSLCLLNTG